MLSLDFAVLIAAVLVILTIVVQLYAAGQINQLKRESAQYEHAKNLVLEQVHAAQQRRSSAVGTRDFYKRRCEEFREQIGAMTGKKVDGDDEWEDEGWEDEEWEDEGDDEDKVESGDSDEDSDVGIDKQVEGEEEAEADEPAGEGAEKVGGTDEESGVEELAPLSEKEEEDLRK